MPIEKLLYKARCVVHGLFQSDVIYNASLHLPVTCISLLYLMLSETVSNGYIINQIEAKTAFLHAILPKSDEIWIQMPKIPGTSCADGPFVGLIKPLSGLRQP